MYRLLFLVGLLAACAHPAPPASVLAPPTPITVAAPIQPELLAALQSLLSDRGFQPSAGLPEDQRDAFDTRSTHEQRILWVHNQEGLSPLALVLSVTARPYAQMGNHYRWTVTVDLTLMAIGSAFTELDASFSVPVFLRFHHQDEADAIQAATPVIHHHLDRLLDAWISAPPS